MDIQQNAFDKSQISSQLGKAFDRVSEFFQSLFSRVWPTQQAPDDFATRPDIPSWEDYESASNAQILERLHRNPGGLLNEQPFIDTLMNVRNTENNRRQTRHVVFAFYILALAAAILAFKNPPPPPQEPLLAEQQRNAEKALENAVGMLKEEFNLKLQGKDMEIRDLKRQISSLNQAQGELTREIKTIARTASVAAKPPAAPKPQVAAKPVALPKPQASTKPQAPQKPN